MGNTQDQIMCLSPPHSSTMLWCATHPPQEWLTELTHSYSHWTGITVRNGFSNLTRVKWGEIGKKRHHKWSSKEKLSKECFVVKGMASDRSVYLRWYQLFSVMDSHLMDVQLVSDKSRPFSFTTALFESFPWWSFVMSFLANLNLFYSCQIGKPILDSYFQFNDYRNVFSSCQSLWGGCVATSQHSWWVGWRQTHYLVLCSCPLIAPTGLCVLE